MDYALFIVTRFREALRAGRDAAGRRGHRDAHRGPGRAHRGTTVVIGMLGLLVLRQALLNGVAIAAAATVAMTVLGSLTLLPALLGFTGTRLARPSRLNTFLGGKVFGGAGPGHGRVPGARTPARSAEKGSPGTAVGGVIQRHPVLAARCRRRSS